MPGHEAGRPLAGRDTPVATTVKKTADASYPMAERQDRRQKVAPLKEKQSPGPCINHSRQYRRDKPPVPDEPSFAKRKYFPKIFLIFAEILPDVEKAGADHSGHE